MVNCICGYEYEPEFSGSCPKCGRVSTQIQDRVDEMVMWARNRIEHCRREEQKFSNLRRVSKYSGARIATEAATERRALQAVLRMIGREHADDV